MDVVRVSLKLECLKISALEMSVPPRWIPFPCLHTLEIGGGFLVENSLNIALKAFPNLSAILSAFSNKKTPPISKVWLGKYTGKTVYRSYRTEKYRKILNFWYSKFSVQYNTVSYVFDTITI